MTKADIYSKLGYSGVLHTLQEACLLYPDYADMWKLSADKVYFSKGHPAVLFVEVDKFGHKALSRISEILHHAWNYRAINLLMAISDTEVRVYNCYVQPRQYIAKDKENTSLEYAEIYSQQVTERTTQKAMEALLTLFSVYNLNNGTIWQNQHLLKKKVLQKERVDTCLITSLKRTSNYLEGCGLSRNIIHALLIRSLFILFLEDKGAAQEAGLYGQIKSGCTSYFDILEDKDATYQLFDLVNSHFNGNITPVVDGEYDAVQLQHLLAIKRCFYDGNIEGDPQLFSWRLFNFEVIRIEVLSEVYEHFLGEMKKERGQYYTPAMLVHLIMQDMMPIHVNGCMKKVLDPTCGSGIFLVEAFKRLVRIYKLKHGKIRLEFQELCQIMTENIFGIEIDETAIKVAAFSLYLALIDELDPKTLWIREDCQLPYLVRRPNDNRGHNLLCANTISEVSKTDLPPIDIVVGNPPFGTNNLPKEIRDYCDKYGFAAEQILPFMHKATEFCPQGKIALIFNSKVLTNNNGKYQRFREWLFSETYVEKVYNLSIFRKASASFGGSLFAEAIAPVAVAYYQAQQPKQPSGTIAYWAPKTFVKSSVIEGVVIDSSDIKYIPRNIIRNSPEKVWKATMWGSFSAFTLLKKLCDGETLRTWLDKNNWVYGRGVNRDKTKLDFVPSRMIDIRRVKCYYTHSDECTVSNHDSFRSINPSLSASPYVLFNQGLHHNDILCTLFEGEGYFTTTAFAFNGGDVRSKKYLVSYLNSDIAKFILFLTTSSWAIERETIMMEEVLEMPSPFIRGKEKQADAIISAYDELVETQKNNFMADTADIQKRINNYFYQVFDISSEEQTIIEDTLKFSLGLFINKEKAVALKRVNNKEFFEYASLLNSQINSFLGASPLNSSATYYEICPYDPLALVVLEFGQDNTTNTQKTNRDMKGLLHALDGQLLTSKAKDLLLQRSVRFYDDNRIYILKANRKSFWTRSQALEDASVIISDILNMGNN